MAQDAFLLAAEKDISQMEYPLRWMIKTISLLYRHRKGRARRDAGKEKEFIQYKPDNSVCRDVYAVEREETETDALLLLLMMEQTLSPDEWDLMRKYCLMGMPLDELASELGMPINRLKVKIHRIRKNFRKISRDV